MHALHRSESVRALVGNEILAPHLYLAWVESVGFSSAVIASSPANPHVEFDWGGAVHGSCMDHIPTEEALRG